MDRKALPVFLVVLALAAISAVMGVASLLLTGITAQRFVPAHEVAAPPTRDACLFAYSPEERLMMDAGMADLGRRVPQVGIDLVYAGSRHWAGRPLYGNLKRAFLQPEVADMLAVAAGLLAQSDSSLRLVVLDAARPVSVEQGLYEAADGPDGTMAPAFRNAPSLHAYGCAVDVTLAQGDSLLRSPEMIYDHMESAGCRYSASSGGEEPLPGDARMHLLQAAMQGAGFRAFSGAWWHFEAYGPAYARRQYAPVP